MIEVESDLIKEWLDDIVSSTKKIEERVFQYDDQFSRIDLEVVSGQQDQGNDILQLKDELVSQLSYLHIFFSQDSQRIIKTLENIHVQLENHQKVKDKKKILSSS